MCKINFFFKYSSYLMYCLYFRKYINRRCISKQQLIFSKWCYNNIIVLILDFVKMNKLTYMGFLNISEQKPF